jgi:hypothetical protein
MSSTPVKVPKLAIPSYVIAQFLRAAEALGRPRKDILAGDILGSSNSSDLYGGPAQRRNIQQKWYELKNLTASRYKALLDFYLVQASTSTLLEVEKEELKGSSKSDEDEDKDELLSESFQHSCAVFTPSPSLAVFTAARALSTPNKVQAALNYQTPDRLMSVTTPSSDRLMSVTTPSSDRLMSVTTPSSVPHEGASVAASSLSEMTTVQAWFGSEGNPHHETVNLDQPEFNNVLQFRP